MVNKIKVFFTIIKISLYSSKKTIFTTIIRRSFIVKSNLTVLGWKKVLKIFSIKTWFHCYRVSSFINVAKYNNVLEIKN